MPRIRSLPRLILASLLLAGAPAVVRAQDQAPAAAPAADSARTMADTAADVLRPGDVVRLKIWREPDLSGDFPVDEQGVVVFPKIGAYEVTGESPATLREKVLSAYQVYLRNPSIDIVFLRRVNVLGAVRNPGVYPIDPTMTLADVIAAAGGAAPNGHPDKVEVRRNGETLKTKLTQRTVVADSPIQSGDQIWVPERSWVSRNSGVVAAAITATVSLAIAIFTR